MGTLDRSESVSSYYETAFEEIHYSGSIGLYSKNLHRSLERKSAEHYSKVLELGAGTGEHLDFVKHTFDEYICLDLELPAKQKIRPGVHFVKGDAENLNYPDDSFDRVLNVCLLHHVSSAEKVLSEMRRVVRPGGQVDIFLPCDPGMMYRWIRHWTTHLKTKRLMKISMSQVKFMWAVEHKGHFLAIKSTISELFKNDNLSSYRFPFPLVSWNINLYVRYRIIKK